MVVLRGERVVLRPLRMDEFATVMEAHRRLSPHDPPGAAAQRIRRRIERSGRYVDGWLDLGIEAGSRLVGDVGARRPRGALPPGVFELGISVFASADRGKGYGGEAVALLTEYLFHALAAHRVQATTAVSNAPMRRVLEKLAFVPEGTLRAFMPGAAGRDDYVMYAVTRGDWSCDAGRPRGRIATTDASRARGDGASA
ncbi:MAG: GNAT family N-acetyltransferase [Actinomycetota bacterium]|nr:GNAT family N-acetyltransferase [Actinomycetota bacterium]